MEPTPERAPEPSLFPSALRGLRAERGDARAELGLERALPFVRTLREYRVGQLRPDFVAGLTTALFAIPQAMAYALIAGFPPSAGIATAVVASIMGAAMGSSEFLINGPTNALSVMLAANAAMFAAHGDPITAVVMLTFLIGAVQVGAGMLRVGTLTRFVSEPVLTGFTAGAGVYIVINQLPSFLGIERAAIPKTLFGMSVPKSALFDLLRLTTSLHATHAASFGLALLTFGIVRGLQRVERRLDRRLPASFAAIVIATSIVWLFGLDHTGSPHHVRVVRDIEALTRNLPALRIPAIDWTLARDMAGPAFAIGLMGSVEAIAIGKLLAARAGHPFDASRQLIGEGFCNLGAAMAGGFASSGSFSRTAVNFDAGAVTRVSCMLSGVLVCVIVLAFAPAANLIPIAALAGTLVHVGLKLVDVVRLRAMFTTTTGDRAVVLITFAGVLLVEHLEKALFVGIAASVYFALRRAEGFKLRVLAESDDGNLGELAEGDRSAVGEVTVLNLQGELFFAAAEVLQAELIRLLDTSARFIVLRVQEAYNMDATTAAAIVHVADVARRRGGRLLLCGIRPGMYGTFERAGLIPQIGQDAFFPAERELLASTRRAIRYASELARAARTGGDTA
jgi:SulP family sulfate permease